MADVSTVQPSPPREVHGLSDSDLPLASVAGGAIASPASGKASRRWIGRGSRWRLLDRIRPRDQGPRDGDEYGYVRPAAIDLDGDGAPEVILGWKDASELGDWVLGRGTGAAPAWEVVARGIMAELE